MKAGKGWGSLPRRLAALAYNTFREAVRDKVFYNLAFFAALMILASFFLGQLSLGEDVKVIKDVGLAAIRLFGILIAVFVGIGQVHKEMERKTIYVLLAKPIRRWHFLVGKFFGLALTLLVEVVALSIGLFGVLIYATHSFSFPLLPALFLIYLELLILTAAALLFVSYSSPFLAMLFSLSFFAIGHSTEDLLRLALKAKQPLLILAAKAFHQILDLDLFNLQPHVVYGLPIEREQILYPMMYALFLIAFFVLAASLLFQRKELK